MLLILSFSFFSTIAQRGADELDLDETYFDHPIWTPAFIKTIVEFVTTAVILAVASKYTEFWQKRSLMIGGVATVILGGISFLNEVAYDSLGQLTAYTAYAGIADALIKISIPLAMIFYTGRDNYKIALPFVSVAGGLGGLVASIIQANPPDDFQFKHLWYACAAVLVVYGIGAVIAPNFFVGWAEYKSGGNEEEKEEIEAVENEEFLPDED